MLSGTVGTCIKFVYTVAPSLLQRNNLVSVLVSWKETSAIGDGSVLDAEKTVEDQE